MRWGREDFNGELMTRRYRVRPPECLLRDKFDLGVEHVTSTTFRNNELGLARVGFDLAPQPQNLYVNAAVEYVVVVATAQFQQLFATENAFWRPQKSCEQGEFRMSQLNTLTVAGCESARTQVEFPSAETKSQRRVALHLGYGRRLSAPQDGPDTGEHLTQIERFRQIVVGTKFQ